MNRDEIKSTAFRNDDALRGIEEFSHLWLIFGFSEAENGGISPANALCLLWKGGFRAFYHRRR